MDIRIAPWWRAYAAANVVSRGVRKYTSHYCPIQQMNSHLSQSGELSLILCLERERMRDTSHNDLVLTYLHVYAKPIKALVRGVDLEIKVERV